MRSMDIARIGLLLPALAAGAVMAGAGGKDAPAEGKGPASNLDYWLQQAKPIATQPADANAAAGAPEASGTNPFKAGRQAFRREDALPGVIELSNGKQLPGGLYTTREKPWIVWNEKANTWRRVPFINLLSITAVVEEERMELSWRWIGMGEPEKVYTGKSYPWRRVHWQFKLLDGSVIEGSTKGQPVWVELDGRQTGPFVLHERAKGAEGQTLQELVYIRKIVVSRRMMDAVVAAAEKQSPPAKGS